MSSAGFSIIDLLVVIGIVGILVSIAVVVRQPHTHGGERNGPGHGRPGAGIRRPAGDVTPKRGAMTPDVKQSPDGRRAVLTGPASGWLRHFSRDTIRTAMDGRTQDVEIVATVLRAGHGVCVPCIAIKARLAEEHAQDALRRMSRELRIERSIANCTSCRTRGELFELR